MSFCLTRRYVFRALHQLPDEMDQRPEWVLHGHNYLLEVTLQGPLEVNSGWVFSRDQLDQVVQKHVIDRLDGQHLNKLFKFTPGEAIADEIFHLLEPHLKDRLHSVALQETGKNRFYKGRGMTKIRTEAAGKGI